MQILLIMLIVVLLAFSVLLLALAKQSPREKQTEDKEQEEYIRDYAETVRQTGGSMKKLEHWKVIAIYLIIYDMICKCKPYIENRNRHRIRSCTIRKRSRQQRKRDPAVQAPDRKRRPCHRHTSGHHPLLYDYPGGRKPCPPGRNLRQRRRDLRPGHGSPGKDRHPCPKPDQAFRLHTGCRHQSHLHRSPPRRKALRRKADGRRRHGENSKRSHPHRQTHRNGRTGILQTAGSPGSIRLRQQRKDPGHRSRDRTDLSLCGFRPEAA